MYIKLLTQLLVNLQFATAVVIAGCVDNGGLRASIADACQSIRKHNLCLSGRLTAVEHITRKEECIGLMHACQFHHLPEHILLFLLAGKIVKHVTEMPVTRVNNLHLSILLICFLLQSSEKIPTSQKNPLFKVIHSSFGFV
jgi:hypothetical protein